MADLANVGVDVKGKWGKFERDAQRRLSGTFGRLGKMGGRLMAVGFGGALAAGGGLLKLGGSFDEMSDTIRIGTGATGTALEALNQTATNVATSIPTSFADAGTAIADINTRLGLTGAPLDEVSRRMLELSRITKTDLTGNIESSSRVLGDWGISVGEMPGTLDALFRASQATGIGFDTLSQQMVAYGAPLRQLGFGFDQSAALLGKFEKEGVNAELVMGSMRIALGKMARDGEPAVETFQRVVEQIEGAGSASEANALALELFGARAGPDMAAAIREGRFEIDDLMATIGDGNETILDAAADTNSWKQSLQVLANKGMARLAPLATRLFNGIGNLLERHGPKIEAFANAVGARLGSAFRAAQGFWARYGRPAVMAIGEHLTAAVGRVEPLVVAVGGHLANAFRVARRFWDRHGARIIKSIRSSFKTAVAIVKRFRDAFVGAFEWLNNNRHIVAGIATVLGTVLVSALAAWTVATWAQVTALWAQATAFIAAYAPIVAIGVALGALVAGVIWAYQNWGWFRDAVDAVASFMTDTLWPILQDVARFLRRNVPRAIDRVVTAAQGFWGVLRTVWRWLRRMWDRAEGVRSFLVGAFQTGLGIVIGVWRSYWIVVRTAWRWAQKIWDRSKGLRSFLVGAFQLGLGVVIAVWKSYWKVIRTAWRWVKNLWDRSEEFRGFLVGTFQTGLGIGVTAIGGLKTAFKGVRNAVQWVIDKIDALLGWIDKIPTSIPNPFSGFDFPGIDIPGFSSGGKSPVNQPFWVGEKGPELMMLPRSGRVLSHEDSMAAVQGARGAHTTTVIVNNHRTSAGPADISKGLRLARMGAGS